MRSVWEGAAEGTWRGCCSSTPMEPQFHREDRQELPVDTTAPTWQNRAAMSETKSSSPPRALTNPGGICRLISSCACCLIAQSRDTPESGRGLPHFKTLARYSARSLFLKGMCIRLTVLLSILA